MTDYELDKLDKFNELIEDIPDIILQLVNELNNTKNLVTMLKNENDSLKKQLKLSLSH